MRIETYTLASVAVLGCVVAALAGCTGERSRGSVIGPDLGPRVVESVLCLAIVEGQPAGITETFAQGEDVNLWARWERLDPPHEVEAVWFDSFGDEVASTILDIDGGSEQVTVFSLELSGLSDTGRWDVELWLDGEFVRGHSFLVVEFLPGESRAAVGPGQHDPPRFKAIDNGSGASDFRTVAATATHSSQAPTVQR